MFGFLLGSHDYIYFILFLFLLYDKLHIILLLLYYFNRGKKTKSDKAINT